MDGGRDGYTHNHTRLGQFPAAVRLTYDRYGFTKIVVVVVAFLISPCVFSRGYVRFGSGSDSGWDVFFSASERVGVEPAEPSFFKIVFFVAFDSSFGGKDGIFSFGEGKDGWILVD